MEEGLTLPVEVAFHEPFGRIRVARAQRLQNAPMFAHGFIKTPRLVDLLVSIKWDLRPQSAHNVVQDAVAGQFLDQRMENVVGGNIFFAVALRVMGFKFTVGNNKVKEKY